MFCSISLRIICSNFSAPPAIGTAANFGNTICPESARLTLPGRMPVVRTISISAGARMVSALPPSIGAASWATP